MDKLDHYRHAIKDVLDECTAIPYAYGDVEPKVVYDDQNGNYLITDELLARGVPVGDIVLGFHPVKLRIHTSFGVA